MKDSPVFWRQVGWTMLVSDLALMAFAGLQAQVNPAAVLVVVLGMPFLLFGAALATSTRFCEWMAKPPRRSQSNPKE